MALFKSTCFQIGIVILSYVLLISLTSCFTTFFLSSILWKYVLWENCLVSMNGACLLFRYCFILCSSSVQIIEIHINYLHKFIWGKMLLVLTPKIEFNIFIYPLFYVGKIFFCQDDSLRSTSSLSPFWQKE